MCCGRGAGKTRSAAERLRERIVSGLAKRIALIAATFADVRDTMVEGESGLQAVCGDLIETYNRSIGEIRFKGGAIAKFFSGEEPDRLRGWQSTDVWGDELAAWAKAQETFDMAMFGLRLGEPEANFTTTPRPIKLLRDLMVNPKCKVTRGSTYDNRANLAPEFFDAVIAKYAGTALGRQEIEGDLLEDIKGALWKRAWFEFDGFRRPDCSWTEVQRDKNGVETSHNFFEIPSGIIKTVVALDPSVTDPELRSNPHKDPDKCGLIVSGIDDMACGHVLADYTAVMSPSLWARAAVIAHSKFKATCIIAEKNQGGELIREVIRGIAPGIPVVLVHASMGKRPRAEPVAMLYEQGRVQHHGEFSELEDQMVMWDASDPRSTSPNNVDALVWSFHGLGLCQATGMRTHDRILERR